LSVANAPTRLGDAELAGQIAGGAATLGIPLSVAQVDGFLAYLRLIEHWNATYNLTAIRNPSDMVTHHLLDSLAAAAALLRARGPGAGRRLLDVGTGAGLPGLIIATVSPKREVVCVDSVAKKTAFVTQAAALLGLNNVTVIHRRVEELEAPPFDEIVSRAFSSLADFVSATTDLLATGGVWMAMKGKLPTAELDNLTSLTFHVEPLRVPGLYAERCLVWLNREASARSVRGSSD
jgi:16S rRNA (guanine527-N7)-methyltransferase